MGIDVQMLQAEKGGDIAAVLASQKKRFASEELVNEVLALYKKWVASASIFTLHSRLVRTSALKQTPARSRL